MRSSGMSAADLMSSSNDLASETQSTDQREWVSMYPVDGHPQLCNISVSVTCAVKRGDIISDTCEYWWQGNLSFIASFAIQTKQCSTWITAPAEKYGAFGQKGHPPSMLWRSCIFQGLIQEQVELSNSSVCLQIPMHPTAQNSTSYLQKSNLLPKNSLGMSAFLSLYFLLRRILAGNACYTNFMASLSRGSHERGIFSLFPRTSFAQFYGRCSAPQTVSLDLVKWIPALQYIPLTVSLAWAWNSAHGLQTLQYSALGPDNRWLVRARRRGDFPLQGIAF